MTTKVVGIGQPAAGDDGVGHAVLAALAAADVPPDVALVRLGDASQLLALFDDGDDVVVVDAIVGAPAEVGEVMVLERGAIDEGAMSGISSHGLGVAQALKLFEVLTGVEPRLRFVAIPIERPTAYREGLSAAVAEAVPRAVEVVLQLVRDRPAPA